jgi:hypothetical protein
MLNTVSDPIDPNADPPEGQSGTGGTSAGSGTTPTSQPTDPPEGQSGGGTT